jgi:Resolvase, N terminal domain
MVAGARRTRRHAGFASTCRPSLQRSHRKRHGCSCGSCSRLAPVPAERRRNDDPEQPARELSGRAQTRFAFYGRVSTEDNQDPEASRAWQLSRARALITPRGGEIVVEFFDVDKSRSIPWSRRPHAAALLAELKNPNRDFDAVVIGEPHRAFYGNQYGLTFPVFEHFQVPMWVPEVGGPIDPANEATT